MDDSRQLRARAEVARRLSRGLSEPHSLRLLAIADDYEAEAQAAEARASAEFSQSHDNDGQ